MYKKHKKARKDSFDIFTYVLRPSDKGLYSNMGGGERKNSSLA
jgi:hypothetical protein